MKPENYYEMTPEEESVTGYANPIRVSDYVELCEHLESDVSEVQMALHSDDTYIGHDYIRATSRHNALLHRKRVLTRMGKGMASVIASSYSDDVISGFERVLSQSSK